MFFNRGSASATTAATPNVFDPSRLISQRALDIDASGIRKVFDLAAKLKDPINLSIGQPDFDVPEPIKERAIAAIRAGKNRYTPTHGIAELIEPLRRDVMEKTSWRDPGLLILSGTSAGIMLAMFSVLNPGDEVLILDPYFVMYKHLPRLIGAVPVPVDSYPDFRFHADRLEAAITSRTKMLVLCSPNNPTGIALTPAELSAAAAIVRKHNLLVLSDEIYDAFCYQEHHSIAPLLPEQCILLRGYSKTYAMTGWRLGYAAGPRSIIEQMTKLQQYTFVCAPSPAQYGALELLHSGHVDMTAHIDAYRRKRDAVVEGLSDLFRINPPGGAFYVFPEVPGGQTATEFVARAIDNNLLIIPGNVFSSRDTHFRLSYAASDQTISRGIAVLRQLGQETAASKK
jgi:aspartate/methionine/tyrosine aminotransferase